MNWMRYFFRLIGLSPLRPPRCGLPRVVPASRSWALLMVPLMHARIKGACARWRVPQQCSASGDGDAQAEWGRNGVNDGEAEMVRFCWVNGKNAFFCIHLLDMIWRYQIISQNISERKRQIECKRVIRQFQTKNWKMFQQIRQKYCNINTIQFQ